MSEQPGAGRLDPEILAAYIDGLLPPEERARVDAEIAADPETYEWVVNSINAVDDPTIVQAEEPPRGGTVTPAQSPDAGPRPGPTGRSGGDGRVLPFYRRRTVQGVVGAILAVAAGLLLVVRTQPVWWQGIWGPSADPRFASLVEAVGEERYIEARLTGGFKYGPLRQVMRGPDDLSSQNLKLLAAAGDLQKAAEREPNAENLHAWGVAQLLLGEWDGAIAALTKASTTPAANARVHADLAAGLLARSSAFGRKEDLPKALAEAERALTIDAHSEVAAFNRALALSGLQLRDLAIDAWRTVLSSSAPDAWKHEAQRYLDKLTKPPLAEWDDQRTRLLAAAEGQDVEYLSAHLPLNTQQTRVLIEDQLLPAAFDEEAAGVTRSPSRQALEVLVAALATATGDRLLGDVLTQARVRPSRAMFDGLRLFGEARALYEQNRISDSMPLFSRALAALNSAGCPMALWAEHHLAIDEYYRGAHDAAIEHQLRVLSVAETRQYLAIAARAHWMIGLSEAVQARHADAISEYQRALELFSRLGETDNWSAVQSLISGAYGALGQDQAAWRYALLALTAAGPSTAPRRLHSILIAASALALRTGVPEASVAFAREALSRAASQNAPDYRAEAALHLARGLGELGHQGLARSAVAAAAESLPAIADERVRLRLEAELMTSESELLVENDPDLALAAARAAVSFFTSTRMLLRLPRAHLAAGRALATKHDDAGAASEYESAISRFEEERAGLPMSQLTRISHYDRIWEASRELLSLKMRSGIDSSAAFTLAERGRARSLSEKLTPGARLTDLPTLRAALRPDECAVYLSQLSDRLVIWRVDRERVEFEAVPQSESTTSAEIDELRRHLQEGRDGWQASASELYGTMFRDLIALRPNIKKVWVVPDQILASVPFQALINPKTKKPLIAEVSVAMAPSAGLLVRRLTARPVDWGQSRALVVAAPLGADPFPPLPLAREEALAVASGFSNASLLLDLEATKANVLSQMRAASVMHFAGHAIVNREFPERSALLLKPDRAGLERLSVGDVIESVARLELVVLSACRTADGPPSGGEGALSLARAFASAGGPVVVSTSWEVSDMAGREWVVAFYRALLAGSDPATASAKSTIQLIDRGVPASQWAAWTTVY